MTITCLPMDATASTPEYSAQNYRQSIAAQHGGGAARPLGGRSGFRVDTGNVLTASSTTWTLTPCAAMIDPGATTHQGVYGWSTDANVTGSVTAADATYARKDVVYIQINDSSAGDGSGALTADVLYTAGTPSASPVAPTLPARSFLVGTITVPQTGGGSPTVVVNPARYAAAGAPLPVSSSTERDALTAYTGLQVIRKDQNGRVETHNGTTWGYVGAHWDFERGVSTDSNPGDITGTTSLMSGTITNAPAGRYRVDFQTCLYSASLFRGFVRVTAGSTFKETRFDWQAASNPLSPTAYMFYTHTGGDLTIVGSYRVTAGQPIVTGAASGLTHVSAVYLGG